MKYDILLRGGEVIDPSQNVRETCDVGIAAGRIVEVANGLSQSDATEVLDCSGLLVVPGLIDLHAHVYWGGIPLGLDPDPLCAAGGVTTIVDTGSAGCGNFDAFRRFIIDRCVPEVLALIHVCRAGLVCADLGELIDPRHADVPGTVQTIRDNPGVAVGVKIRASDHIIGTGETGWQNFHAAVAAARESGTWLMVHIGNSPMTIPEMLQHMQPGDCITHCFKGGRTRILDSGGKPYPEVLAAAQKGVVFDVGHGSGSFEWETVEAALEHGFRPTTISTDLHTLSIRGPVFDMPTTMSKFLLLGIPLEEVIAMSTSRPAAALGRDDIGTLKAGTVADLAVLAHEHGRFTYHDSYGGTREGSERLSAALTIRRGRIIPGGAGARAAAGRQWPAGRPAR